MIPAFSVCSITLALLSMEAFVFALLVECVHVAWFRCLLSVLRLLRVGIEGGAMVQGSKASYHPSKWVGVVRVA